MSEEVLTALADLHEDVLSLRERVDRLIAIQERETSR